jgi:hypothetical protein
MGNFYNPQPPSQGPSNSTLPLPHDPIPAQGDQPPRRQVGIVLVMAAVLAAWPPDLEPRLHRPNDQRQKIAPLTPIYGQQPPIIGTIPTTQDAQIIGSWPFDLEPRLGQPNNRQQSIAPLTLTYGTSPPIIGTLPVTRTIVGWSWPADLEPRLGRPNEQQQKIAPLTLVYGQPPPTIGTQPITEYAQISSAWPADLEPRLSIPNNRQQTIALLTLIYGSQPTLQPPLTLQELQSISAWSQPDWPSQSAPRSIAWFIPPIISSIPNVPFPYALILSQWPADLEPRLGPPNNRLNTTATLALPTGDRPAIVGAFRIQTFASIVSAWPLDDVGKSVPFNLKQTPPSFVPPAGSHRLILVDGRLAIQLSGIVYTWLE